MTRVAAAVVSIALVGAAVSPVVREPWDDGFPLSTYPMFASPRPTMLTMEYAVGVTASGARRTLTPELVGAVETLQAMIIIAQARDDGRLSALCHTIAARVAEDHHYADLVAVRIVTGIHDAVEFLVRHQAGSEVDRASCAVPR